MEKLTTIAERKAYMTVCTFIGNAPFAWKTLSLAIEGRYTNLRIWIGNEKSIADGCGRQMIYMRLDAYKEYSVPFNKETANYLNKKNEVIDRLLSFYEFGQTDVSRLDEVLEITKDLVYRPVLEW